MLTALLVVIAIGAGHGEPASGQDAARGGMPGAFLSTATGAPASALSWTFDASQSAGGNGWTAERGTFTVGQAGARLQPDVNRRVVLLSPPGLPEAARQADEFVLGVAGDAGLQRVRVQARRDARGGWITIADATGGTLRAVPGGYAITRKAGARDAHIERLRIELTFRTTNPRALTRIVAIPAPG